jgi:hypothetical protein
LNRVILFVLAATLTASGCLPIGSTYYELPRVDGKLIRGGEPAGGIEVWSAGLRSPFDPREDGTWWFEPDACLSARDSALVVVTDRDGSYRLPGAEGRSPFWFPLQPSVYAEWALMYCFDEGDHGVRKFVIDSYGPPVPQSALIECEIGAEPVLCTYEPSDS